MVPLDDLQRPFRNEGPWLLWQRFTGLSSLASYTKWMTVGEFCPGAHQPLWFSKPKLLMDTQRVRSGVTRLTWLAMYASLTERDGERVLWYADRKQFVLGRRIGDDLLADMKASV